MSSATPFPGNLKKGYHSVKPLKIVLANCCCFFVTTQQELVFDQPDLLKP